MTFDIGLFGGGGETGSFTQERFTDQEGDNTKEMLMLKLISKQNFEIHRPRR